MNLLLISVLFAMLVLPIALIGFVIYRIGGATRHRVNPNRRD